MSNKNGLMAFLAIGMILLASAGTVYAQDLLEQADKSLKDTDEATGRTFFALFPGFEESLNSTLNEVDKNLSFMKDNHWIFYVIFLIALISFSIKVWEMSDGLFINSVLGIAALLIILHMFDMAIKVTLLRFSLVFILGLGGVLIVLAFDFLGLPI
jgi:hypothetical protein